MGEVVPSPLLNRVKSSRIFRESWTDSLSLTGRSDVSKLLLTSSMSSTIQQLCQQIRGGGGVSLLTMLDIEEIDNIDTIDDINDINTIHSTRYIIIYLQHVCYTK